MSRARGAVFVRSVLPLALLACELEGSTFEGGASEGGAALGGERAEGGNGGGASGGASAGGANDGGDGGDGGSALMGEPCEIEGVAGVCVEVSECTLAGWAPRAGFCPGPADIQCCRPIPEGTCDPEATPLPNAGLVEEPGEGGCLPGMVRVEDFCVDRFEAFLVTFPEMEPVSPFFNPGDAQVMAVSAEGAIPQGYINALQANDACVNAGKRLCTDDEWLRACQGPAGNIYPYGDTLALGTCNDHRDQHPAVEYFMSSDPFIWSELGHPCLNQLESSLGATGAFPGCESAEGALDLMGNLHEWTDNPAGTFRGGFYVDTSLNGPGCLYATTAHDVAHWDYSTGFRCCGDP
ncbi:MAG: SUMF1/EgtB/PvdO family nonheme iron enzyme [Polyangiaceae bacterium]|nr:SUMF1/EgtB/PvdO family nonheme iron enzyme [Polyangiaceae bacterium]